MKFPLLLLLLVLIVFRGHAQVLQTHNVKLEAIDPVKDLREFQGFQVKLGLSDKNGYNFELLHNNKQIEHHFKNPAPFITRGIRYKEDIYKLAQWIIEQHEKTGHWESMVPPHVVRLLDLQSTKQ